jgi:hypothetical protein
MGARRQNGTVSNKQPIKISARAFIVRLFFDRQGDLVAVQQVKNKCQLCDQLCGGALVSIGGGEACADGSAGEKDNVTHALIPDARFCVSKSQ